MCSVVKSFFLTFKVYNIGEQRAPRALNSVNFSLRSEFIYAQGNVVLRAFLGVPKMPKFYEQYSPIASSSTFFDATHKNVNQQNLGLSFFSVSKSLKK